MAYSVVADATDNRCLRPKMDVARDALQVGSLWTSMGYSNGEHTAALEARDALAHIPANRAVSSQDDDRLFDPAAFHYEKGSAILTCPAGHTLTRRQLSRGGRHRDLSRTAGGLRPVSAEIRVPPTNPSPGARHLHEEALPRKHARATPEVMRRRCTVEHPLASLKHRIIEKPRLLLHGIGGAGTEMATGALIWNLKRAIRVLGTGNSSSGWLRCSRSPARTTAPLTGRC